MLCWSLITCHSLPVTCHSTRHCPLVSAAERAPLNFSCRDKPVPVMLETVRQLSHFVVQRSDSAQGAQIVPVGFVLGKSDDFAIAQFAKKCDIGLANRRPQI